jgi:hypothetical protein
MLKGNACMTARAAKLGLAMLAVCVVGLLLFNSARAQGIGIVPATIEIDDAARGGEYTKLVTLFNEGTDEVTFEVAKDGEAAIWASLHPVTDPNATLDKVVVPAKTSTRILLRIAVPPEAANGVEDGVIAFNSVVTDNSAAGAASASVNAAVSVQLSVNVSGSQRLAGEVLDSYADDVEVGNPLSILTTFSNTGNVEAKPEIKSTIKDSSGSVVGEVDKSDTRVEAGQANTIESQWDTSGRDLGSYVASVAVTLDGKQIFNQDISFDVVAVGTLRQGILQKITLKNSPQPGGVAEVSAYFQNKTHEETQAAFVAEVYYGDQLVDAITTSEQPAPPNETTTIQTSVNVANEGKYTVRGKVTFGGRETETKELVFKVGQGGGLPIWAIVAGVVVVVLLLVSGGVTWGLLRRLPHPRRPEV